MAGVRVPAVAKEFSSDLCVQICSEDYKASYTLGTGGPFPGVKRGWGVTLTTHSHLVPRSRMIRNHTPLPLGACMVCGGTLTYRKNVWNKSRWIWQSGTSEHISLVSPANISKNEKENAPPYFHGSVALDKLEHVRTNQIKFIVSQLWPGRRC
jgi:hypothetical protein